MKLYECGEPNNNIPFFISILNSLNFDKNDYKWVVSDLELIPIFHGDYSGTGSNDTHSLSYCFVKRTEHSKIVIIDSFELFNVLKDTQSIRNGVFICIENHFNIDINNYRPKVECKNTNQPYDSRAKYEIRILDGDLFFVL